MHYGQGMQIWWCNTLLTLWQKLDFIFFLLLKITRLNMFWIISVIMKCDSYKCTKVMSSLTIIYKSKKFIFNIYIFSVVFFLYDKHVYYFVSFYVKQYVRLFLPSKRFFQISLWNAFLYQNCTKHLPWKHFSVHLILPHHLPSPK